VEDRACRRTVADPTALDQLRDQSRLAPAEVPGSLERLAEVTDPRDPRGVRHALVIVLALNWRRRWSRPGASPKGYQGTSPFSSWNFLGTSEPLQGSAFRDPVRLGGNQDKTVDRDRDRDRDQPGRHAGFARHRTGRSGAVITWLRKDWTGDARACSLQSTVTPPEEVRPMNAVSMWVLHLPVTAGRLT
jgi:hypothetical protein